VRNEPVRGVGFPLSKRRLGETYIAGTGAVMGTLLVALLARGGVPAGVFVVGFVSVCALVSLTCWLGRLDLDSEQVWYVAECGALATGVLTLLFFGTQLTARLVSTSPTLTVGMVVAVTASTGGGVLVGLAHELQRSTRALSLRNQVLHRVLQHYLRNDMTVVLAQIDHVKATVDGPERGKLETAERKIGTLLALTDNVCAVDGSGGPCPRVTVDIVTVVRERVANLRQSHPEVEIVTDLPETGSIEADDRIGLVVNNVVESAVRYSTGQPVLRIEGFVDDGEFVVRIADEGATIPEADLSALASGDSDTFECGRGIELWLVHWLTERSGGQVTVGTDHSPRWIELRFDRTANRESLL